MKKSQIEQILKMALDLNFYGKRLLTVKDRIAELIIESLELEITSAKVRHILEKNKPVKSAKAKAAKEELPPLVPTFKGTVTERDKGLSVLPCGRYIITSAQNNTQIHACFSELVEQSKQLDASLLVMPIMYTTTLEQREKKEPNFHADLKPYLLSENCFIGSRKGVRLCVTAAILPTAKQPINTAKQLNTGEALTLVSSPKSQILTLPRPKGGDHRWLYTSKTATKRHYTDSRIGDESEAEHTFGGIDLEVFPDGTIDHCELIAEEESGFIFNPKVDVHGVVGLIAGDLHCEKMDKNSFSRLLGQLEKYQPNHLVTHDTLDMESRNHHNRNSGRFLYQMGTKKVIDDLGVAVDHLQRLAALVPELFIVASNHDDALSGWLDDPHYRADHDPLNSKTYHYLKYCIMDHIDNSEERLNVFDLACRELSDQVGELPENIQFGHLDQQFKINGVECGQHGHNGSGGARGSARTFKGYQMPIITGHTHSPQKNGNQVTVGVTGSLEMGYNKGGSAWDRANALILESGIILLVPVYKINEPQT